MRATTKKTRRGGDAETRSGASKKAAARAAKTIVLNLVSSARKRKRAQAHTPRAPARPSCAHVAKCVPAKDPDEFRKRLGKFLRMLAEAVSHKRALEDCGLSWPDVAPLLRHGVPDYDEDFATAYKLAREAGEEYRLIQLREDAADKALIGWDEPVYQQGLFVGNIRRFSEKLHEIALRARDPAYSTTRHEVTGKDGKDLTPAEVRVLLPPMPSSMADFEKAAREVHQREEADEKPPDAK